MNVTATDAKNRLGQVLESAQSAPVFIEKAGRRHSVVLSAARYDDLLRAEAGVSMKERVKRFNAQYKEWIDEQNRLVETYGVFGEEWRPW